MEKWKTLTPINLFRLGEKFRKVLAKHALAVASSLAITSQWLASSAKVQSRPRAVSAFFLRKLSKAVAEKAITHLSTAIDRIVSPLQEAWPSVTDPALNARAASPMRSIRVVGFANRQFGLGVSAKRYLEALKAIGVEVEYIEPDLELPHKEAVHSIDSTPSAVPPDVTLFFVNPDQLSDILPRFPSKRRGEAWIGCWFWELENLPSTWRPIIEKMDAVVASTDFIRDAFLKVTNHPIFKVPVPIAAHNPAPKNPGSTFRFVAMFDFHSAFARKNPLGVVEAFKLAFPDPGIAVELILKASNAGDFPGLFRKVVLACDSDQRIRIVSEILPPQQHAALLSSANAFVSLHRSEGFGMGLAEAMAMGIPVIATGWSGNMEFMDEASAMLVDFTLRAVRAGEYPHYEGCRWAEPDISHAARLMRQLQEDPLVGTNLAERGRERVRSHLNIECSAIAMCSHIDDLMAGLSRTQPILGR